MRAIVVQKWKTIVWFFTEEQYSQETFKFCVSSYIQTQLYFNICKTNWFHPDGYILWNISQYKIYMVDPRAGKYSRMIRQTIKHIKKHQLTSQTSKFFKLPSLTGIGFWNWTLRGSVGWFIFRTNLSHLLTTA